MTCSRNGCATALDEQATMMTVATTITMMLKMMNDDLDDANL